jgi:hypothetical protein
MHNHALASICGGLILTVLTTGIGSDGIAGTRPNFGSPVEVNRTQKADRLPMVQIKEPRAPHYDAKLPAGCESVVSPLTLSQLARIAGRCVS